MMSNMLTSIMLANLLTGLVGVGGAFALIVLFSKLRIKTMLLVSFAAGTMVAVTFFDLLPDAIARHGDLMTIMEFFVLGFIVFLLIEKAFIYYHCHEENCVVHSSAKMVMVGDAVHNFFDGVSIAASFLANPALGVFTTVAIMIHEIPQEIGDIGVLLHAGYGKWKALLFNFFSAIAAIIGGVSAYYFLSTFESYIPYVLSLTAGGFIYVAAADLLPQIHNDSETRLKISLHSTVFIIGIAIIWTFVNFINRP